MSAVEKETNRQTILHYWNQGIRNGDRIHALTKINRSTVFYNLKKLREKENVDHRKGNGRRKKITAEASRAIGQYVRRDSSLSLKTITNKLTQKGIDVSTSTVSRHLKEHNYKKALPITTPMLTSAHKEKRVEWARQHLNDNWRNTLFTDETAFQLFRNTIERWYKGKRPIRPMPKDRRKIFAWGGFCSKGKTSLYCFTQIMDASFYIQIIEDHLPEIKEKLGASNKIMTPSTLVGLPRHSLKRMFLKL